MGIDEAVETLESILRQLEAGRVTEAGEATRHALTAAVEQQQAYWAHCEKRQQAELAWQQHATEPEGIPW